MQTPKARKSISAKQTPTGSVSTSASSSIEDLQNQLLSNPVANVNNLAILFEKITALDFNNDEQRGNIKTSISSMVQVFENLLSKKLIRFNIASLDEESKSAAQLKFKQFVAEKYKQFKQYFVELISSNVHTQTEIEILKSFLFLTQSEVKHAILLPRANETLSSQQLETTKQLLKQSLYLLLSQIISLPSTEEKSNLIILFMRENYVKKFEDVKYFTFCILCDVLKEYEWKQKDEPSKSLILRNILDLVADVTFDPSKDFYFARTSRGDDENSTKRKKVENIKTQFSQLTSIDSYKSVFSDFWIQFLSLPFLSTVIYQQILMKMDDYIIPNFTNPFLLNDFISSSFGKGGLVTMLSIKSLFTLIAKYNLVFPNFYDRLYTLLDADMFNLPHRQNFFQLLYRLLKSTLLPNYLVAAFIKKLARLALSVPPHAILYIIVLIYDLIFRYPEMKSLIHINSSASNLSDGPLAIVDHPLKKQLYEGKDPFDYYEQDPNKCNAIHSTLWELETLKHHYNPIVVEYINRFFAHLQEVAADVEKEKMFGVKSSIKIPFPTADNFTQVSYAQLMKEETLEDKKNRRKDVLFEMQKQKKLFGNDDFIFDCFQLK